MQHRLTTGMVERHEASTPPRNRLADVIAQREAVWLDLLQGTQSGHAKSNHHRRGDECELASQVRSTISQFSWGRWSIATTTVPWIAEDGVGDKNLRSS